MSWPIEFTFHGEPVPAARPRVTRNGSFTPEKYAAYKKSLTAALNAEYGFYGWDIPPTTVPTERQKWMKANRYRLAITAYVSSLRADWDNLGKTVSDAIEQAGIIANDSQIDDAQVLKVRDKASPRVEIKLWRL